MRLSLFIIFLFVAQGIYGICPAKILSVGSFSFKAGNQTYQADSTHARGYANRTTGIGYITAANKLDMVVDIEMKDMNKAGRYTLRPSTGKVLFTIDNKTYMLKRRDDYLQITITRVSNQGSFLLLNGKFEGILTDKLGNVIRISEGIFETKNL